jgi:hypothetical protein
MTSTHLLAVTISYLARGPVFGAHYRFSILVRKLLRRASFTSIHDLRERILAFIDYFNKTMAKPFKWTYKGRPLAT